MKGLAKPCAALMLLAAAGAVYAQPIAGGRGDATAHRDARAAAPVDLTGYWVSIITQNWVFRMAVPQRGQYTGIPINARARAFADAWTAAADAAAGRQCEAYGAAAIMQVPERLRIGWQDANTLQVQIDAGMQLRLLKFTSTAASTAVPSRQGDSVAQWMPHEQAGQTAQHGWLQVSTTNMLPGLLRKNGVPYSGQARMTENWVANTERDGDRWLTVTSILHDPVYLQQPYISNAIFEQEPDGSRWAPASCSLQ